MLNKLVKNESGYSLPELMVAILILTATIVPMASMFDGGLRAAGKGSNYDKARALSNKQLERAKSLPYNSTDSSVTDAKDNFPSIAPTTTNYSGGKAMANDQKDPDAEYAEFRYDAVKEYIAANGGNTASFAATGNNTDSGMIRVTVTVKWGGSNFDDNTYTTVGVVTR